MPSDLERNDRIAEIVRSGARELPDEQFDEIVTWADSQIEGRIGPHPSAVKSVSFVQRRQALIDIVQRRLTLNAPDGTDPTAYEPFIQEVDAIVWNIQDDDNNRATRVVVPAWRGADGVLRIPMHNGVVPAIVER